MTNRRGFLGLLAGAAAAAALDPERLLWVPGAKTISIPAAVRPFRMFHHANYAMGFKMGFKIRMEPLVEERFALAHRLDRTWVPAELVQMARRHREEELIRAIFSRERFA